MTFSREHQKTTLAAMIAILVLLNGYRYFTGEQPKTAPLAFPRGMVAPSPVRQGLQARAADPLRVFVERTHERYPGVIRDIFRMESAAARPLSKPTPTVVVSAPSAPSAPVRTPEEIAADLSRTELSKFRYLGYLTEKDNTLFLSKDGELFIVKSGGKVLNIYKVREASKDSVVILDTVTSVERRVDLSGDGAQQQQSPPQPPALQRSQPPPQPPPLQQSQPPPQPPAFPRPQQVEPPKLQPQQQQAEQPADQPTLQRKRRYVQPR